MRARNSFFSTGILLLLSSIAIAPVVSAQNSNSKPSTLNITKLDDKTATISAHFSTLSAREKKVGILLDKESVTFFDDGTSGDLRAGDGFFSAKVDFDFEAFTKANMQLAKATNGEKTNLFSPGGRQQITQQRIAISGEKMEFFGVSNGKEQTFTLPFDPSLIKVNQPITLPLFNLPIGLPVDFDPVPTAVSIPQSLMITDVSVVNDPVRTWACPTSSTSPVGNATGEWTFWRLMENMANGTSSTSDYIKALFKHWTINQTINGFNVAARPGVYQEVIKDWEIRSGGPGATLLPQESPFRLLVLYCVPICAEVPALMRAVTPVKVALYLPCTTATVIT